MTIDDGSAQSLLVVLVLCNDVVHWDWDATTAKHYIVQNGMVAEGWLGLGCRRIVCNTQIINWGILELPSVVYGAAAQLLLLVRFRWIRRRS